MKMRIATLEAKLQQQKELHDEWVATMKSIHGAALESLERIRVGEAHGRAITESMFETNGTRR